MLELLLTYVIPRRDTNPIAHNLINHFGSFTSVLDAKREELESIEGIGPKAANFLISIKHFFYAYNKGKLTTNKVLDSVPKAVGFVNTILKGRPNEEFYVICLDNYSKVKHYELINTGTSNKAEVSIRKVLEVAFKTNATNIIACHNHPTGSAIPSFADNKLTKALMISLAFNNIVLTDHIIVSPSNFFSYKRSEFWAGYTDEANKTVGHQVVMQKPCEYKDE